MALAAREGREPINVKGRNAMLTYLAATGLLYLSVALVALSLLALLLDWKINRATAILFGSMMLASSILVLLVVIFGEGVAQPIGR